MADNSNKDKNNKENDGSEEQPMNKRTPGNKGRKWRGDSADFSEDKGRRNDNIEF